MLKFEKGSSREHLSSSSHHYLKAQREEVRVSREKKHVAQFSPNSAAYWKYLENLKIISA